MRLQLWKPYVPSDEHPWNIRRVVHLHRRAALAATWPEVQRDLRDGPEKSIDQLLDGTAAQTGALDDFEALSDRLGETAVRSGRIHRLRAWLLFRAIFTPDPLTERLALMWHNHFATSNHKVQNLSLMKQQNDVFRKYAKAEFAELLPRAVKSPAMLIWLDAQANRMQHPNENLARELMELFSLGVGNYSERDVKEAARALTGWTVGGRGSRQLAGPGPPRTANPGRPAFRFEQSIHDAGEKTIFDQTGRSDGDDLLRLVLEHPAVARRLAFRITELFMGEGAVDNEAIEELASGLRSEELSIVWAVETVLRSERFFDDGNIGNRPLAPVEYIIGAVRALELFEPAPSTLLLAEWSTAMGQALFYPPNVFGWPGGRAWLTTRTLIARSNFAQALVSGAAHNPVCPFNAGRFAMRHEASSPNGIRSLLSMLLCGEEVETVPDKNLQSHVSALLSSPDGQLG